VLLGLAAGLPALQAGIFDRLTCPVDESIRQFETTFTRGRNLGTFEVKLRG
jgi:hypothetical protein